jgi:hypothetical protein
MGCCGSKKPGLQTGETSPAFDKTAESLSISLSSGTGSKSNSKTGDKSSDSKTGSQTGDKSEDKTGSISGLKTVSKTVSSTGDRMTQIGSKSGSKIGSKTKSETRSKAGETSPPFDITPESLWSTRGVFAWSSPLIKSTSTSSPFVHIRSPVSPNYYYYFIKIITHLSFFS